MIASGTDLFRTGLTGMEFSIEVCLAACHSFFYLTIEKKSIKLELVPWSDQVTGYIFAELELFCQVFFMKNLPSGGISMADYERIKEVILTGRVEEISGVVKRALEQGTNPQDVIGQGLIAGMNEVGSRFKNGDMFIPEVLVSAKTMHQGMEILRPLLTKEGARSMGTVVLGTVKGDLHDIGKNLVGMMFEGAGFEVVDLGVDQSPEKFVEAAREKGGSGDRPERAFDDHHGRNGQGD